MNVSLPGAGQWQKIQAARSVERAAELIEPRHPKLSMRTQCKLLRLTRSSLSYVPVEENGDDRSLKRILDELYVRDPCWDHAGS